MIDPENPVVKLCAAGMQAEADGRLAEAAGSFQLAWESSGNDYEACIAAHYLARHQSTPEAMLQWNQEALNRAQAAGDDRVRDFYPSLYLNLGYSYEQLGDLEQARGFYQLAAELASSLGEDRYAGVVRDGAARGLLRVDRLQAEQAGGNFYE